MAIPVGIKINAPITNKLSKLKGAEIFPTPKIRKLKLRLRQ